MLVISGNTAQEAMSIIARNPEKYSSFAIKGSKKKLTANRCRIPNTIS